MPFLASQFPKLLAITALLFISATCLAADLRGLIWAGSGTSIPAGAQLLVTCDGVDVGAAALVHHQEFSVRGIPAGKSCQYRIVFSPEVSSRPVAFDARKTVVNVRGELQQLGSTLILIAK